MKKVSSTTSVCVFPPPSESCSKSHAHAPARAYTHDAGRACRERLERPPTRRLVSCVCPRSSEENPLTWWEVPFQSRRRCVAVRHPLDVALETVRRACSWAFTGAGDNKKVDFAFQNPSVTKYFLYWGSNRILYVWWIDMGKKDSRKRIMVS